LVCGFGALISSDFVVNSDMALFSTFIIAMALFADFILLPATILKFEKNKTPETKVKQSISA
jgi:predicted RND superfamily exporter protein